MTVMLSVWNSARGCLLSQIAYRPVATSSYMAERAID